ncbi:MAG: helix-turn-helix domain-containing protein [bacterium]|nr:helix-turn-helix domain-containing protein [bacterium]
MRKHKFYTFEDDLRKRLKDPEFKKIWNDSEPERLLGKSLIGKIIQKKINYKKLARKSKVSEQTIYRIVFDNSNPKLSTLKRIATALNSKLVLQFK